MRFQQVTQLAEQSPLFLKNLFCQRAKNQKKFFSGDSVTGFFSFIDLYYLRYADANADFGFNGSVISLIHLFIFTAAAVK